MADLDITIDLTALYDAMEKHDWTFWADGDEDKRKEGADFYKSIMEKATQSADAKKLFEQYREHKYAGTPKPERPEK